MKTLFLGVIFKSGVELEYILEMDVPDFPDALEKTFAYITECDNFTFFSTGGQLVLLRISECAAIGLRIVEE